MMFLYNLTVSFSLDINIDIKNIYKPRSKFNYFRYTRINVDNSINLNTFNKIDQI